MGAEYKTHFLRPTQSESYNGMNLVSEVMRNTKRKQFKLVIIHFIFTILFLHMTYQILFRCYFRISRQY